LHSQDKLRPVVSIVRSPCEPASYYYRIMSRNHSMPVLIGERICRMRCPVSTFTQLIEVIRGERESLEEAEGEQLHLWTATCMRICQHLSRFEAAVRRELERFLEAARRGDGVAGAGEERVLAEYVERLLEELRPGE